MKRIECNLPDSLYGALMKQIQINKTSCDHVVSTALSQCLRKPLHTLFGSVDMLFKYWLFPGALRR
jgi:acetolactate decarboxylase